MQWLTAILAFATTMLIFAIIVSTIVETIHRFFGSRSFGLIIMLEYVYDDIIYHYLTKEDVEIQREDFVASMIKVRAPAIHNVNRQNSSDGVFGAEAGFFAAVTRPFGRAYLLLNGASKTAQKLGVSQWQLLSSLSVVTFMERLGSSAFSDVLERKYTEDPEKKDQLLKDIAQKFELYGQESTLYFGRKARTISVGVAMFVAWAFYVHPYDLIQTFLQKPEVAVKVADLHEDALDRFGLLAGKLEAVSVEERALSDKIP